MVSLINKNLLEQILKDNSRKVLVLDRGNLLPIFLSLSNFSDEQDSATKKLKENFYHIVKDRLELVDNQYLAYLNIERNNYAFTVCGLMGKEVCGKDLPYNRGIVFLKELERMKQPALVITFCDDFQAKQEATSLTNLLGYFTQPPDEKRLLYVLNSYCLGRVK